MKPKYARVAQLQYLSLVIPGMIVFTAGLIVPMLLSFGFSLTDWSGLVADPQFVGFENYRRMFSDQHAWQAWGFTIRFTVLNVIIQNVGALLLALALDSAIKFKKLFRTLFFIPCLIAPVVVGFVWQKMFGNVLPAVSRTFDLGINMMLLGSPDTVLTGLLIANNWQWIGYWMIIYLAALQSIPNEMYEAARVDGANRLKQFWHVTLPMLAPAITICVVGITVGSLRVYDLLVASTAGGPGRASISIIYYIFNTSVGALEIGYGSALTMSVIVALLAVAVVQINILRRREVQL